ncbi:MAG: hypothetical protein ACRDYA_21660 [Egibacteraceae bacterium]
MTPSVADGLISAEPIREPSALDVPKGAEVLLFATDADVDYGAVDQAEYIRTFDSAGGVVDLDVRCVDPEGAPLTAKVSSSPGNRQAELAVTCTVEQGHQHVTYDLGPPYPGSRWIAEVNAHRGTRFHVLVTQPGPTPTPKPRR